MPGTGSIGGLVSGLDTASLIDQLISVSRKRIDVVVANQTSKSDKITAFQGFNLQLADFQTSAKTLKDSDTFNVFTTSTSTDSVTYSADNLATITATSDASPGNHTISFTDGSQIAEARQISSQSYSDFDTTTMGISGEILINGSVITIATTDTLEDIAVKINNANSGTNATKVTASIISVTDTDNRLILTSDDTGEDAFDIISASATDILESLGFTYDDPASDVIKNPTSDGAESDEFSNSQTAIGSLLGLTNPQSNTVTIAGYAVPINLSTESLTTIASNINDLANVTATVVPTTSDAGVTTYKIDISGTSSFTDADNILETLGIRKGLQAAIAEVHVGSFTNESTSGGGVITDATTYGLLYTGLLSDDKANTLTTAGGGPGNIVAETFFGNIDTGGDNNNITDNDTISISGTKQDGTAVAAYNFTITTKATVKVQALLTDIEEKFDLTTGSVMIDSAGKIQINDDYSGNSQLAIAFVESAGNLDLGTLTADSNVADGDTITISGTDHDGNAVPAGGVSGTFTIDVSKAFNDASTTFGLLAKIEEVFESATALEIPPNTVTATIVNGQIVVTDDYGGDSQITVSIIANNNISNGTLNFGTVLTTNTGGTEGYSMQTTAGQDAKVKIDGVNVIRTSNIIDDVIRGVTIDVSRVESGSSVDVNISRDTGAIKTSVNDFITKYNSAIDFINREFKFNEDMDSAGTLSGESTLSSIKTSIQSIITGTISLLPAGENALSLIGITSDSDGKLTLKDSTFLSELNSDFNAVKRMFIAEGTATNSEVTFISHNKYTTAGDYDVNITQAATKAGETGELDLGTGLGSGKVETIKITDTASGRNATITLNGDTTTGDTIDNIVSTINSALDTETTQTLVGVNPNSKTTAAGGNLITSSTKFNEINTGGDANDIDDNDTINYDGTMRNGIAVSGSYVISDASTNTVQNLLSAIENDYGNTVSATIDSSGNIVLTDNTVGDSSLSIAITSLDTNLSFGDILTTGTGVLGRYAMEITASKDENDQLVITHDNYGSDQGFTIAQVDGNDADAGNESLIASEANTAGGPITGLTTFLAIDGASASADDTITMSGTQHDGTAVASYDFTITAINTVEDLLDDIETQFGLTGGSVTINGSGQIEITDVNNVGVSQLSVNLVENREGGGNLEFGTVASLNTGIANGTQAGLDVAGTINGEAATGTGQLLRGDDPGDGSSSVEGLAIKVTSTTESLVGSVANTESSNAIDGDTTFQNIDGAGVVVDDFITISGKKHDGTPVNFVYTINPISTAVSDMLTEIENNFGLDVGDVTIDSDGKIAISDTFTGDSQLSITLDEDTGGSGNLDFGDIIPGDKDTVRLTMGVAETMYNKLLAFTDAFDGLVTIRIDGLGDTVDNLQETIDGMNERLAMEATTLNNKFVQLELSLSRLQNVSSFLAQQLAQLSK